MLQSIPDFSTPKAVCRLVSVFVDIIIKCLLKSFYICDFFVLFNSVQKLQTTEKQLKERIKTIADLEHELEKMRGHLGEGRQVGCYKNLLK